MINLLKRLYSPLRKSQANSILFSTNDLYGPDWTPCEYESLAAEGFQKNVIAYRAINLISRSIASIPINVIKNGEVLKKHVIYDLLKRPNIQQGYSSFVESIMTYLLVSGNTFIYTNIDTSIDNNNTQNTDNLENIEMYCLRPDRIKITTENNNTNILKYTYSIGSESIDINKSNILHLKFFNPLNDWYGYSPLQAASRSIDLHNEMSTHNVSLLQNGCRPSGCLKIKNGVGHLTDEERDQLRANIKEAYSGGKNIGKLLVLEGDFEWKEMGLSPKDLDFNSGKNTAAREIAQAFGVPALLVGVTGDSAYSNYKEARLHLWEDTIIPLAEYIKHELNNWFCITFKQITSDIELQFNYDAVPALINKREILWQKISNANFLTINEKREILGFGKIDSNDLQKNKNFNNT